MIMMNNEDVPVRPLDPPSKDQPPLKFFMDFDFKDLQKQPKVMNLDS